MELPLSGKKILITREERQAKKFAQKVIEQGGQVYEVPLIKISCIESAHQQEVLKNLSSYEWIFITSVNGVECFFEQIKSSIDLSHVHFAVVGSKTEEALNRYGYQATLVPSIFDGENLVREFLEKYTVNGQILLVQGSRSRDVISQGLTEASVPLQTIVVYETGFNDEVQERLQQTLNATTFDFITFTSPSSVEAFMEYKAPEEEISSNTEIVCIGKTTENRAKELGLGNTIIPDSYTIEGMIEVMCNRAVKFH